MSWPDPSAWPARLVDPDRATGLTLRPLALRDTREWAAVRARNVEWLGPWDATAPPQAVSDRPATMRSACRALLRTATAGQAMPFVLEVDGRFRGQVSVNNIVRGSAQWGSVGYWIDSEVAGRGLMPRAVALVIDHCLGPGRLHRVEIAIRPENSSSLRVVEKLGIAEVGYAPAYLHIAGGWRDHRLFAVTAEQVGPEGVRARL